MTHSIMHGGTLKPAGGFGIATRNLMSCCLTADRHRSSLARQCIDKMQSSNNNSSSIDLFGISNTRWTGKGSFRIVQASGNNWLVIHSGASSGDTDRGVAIVVSKRLQQFVSNPTYVLPRLVSIDVNLHLPVDGENCTGTVIQAFAPRYANYDEDYKEFWAKLQDLVKQAKSQNKWLLIMGDFGEKNRVFYNSLCSRFGLTSIRTSTKGSNFMVSKIDASGWPRQFGYVDVLRISGSSDAAASCSGRSLSAVRCKQYRLGDDGEIDWPVDVQRRNEPTDAFFHKAEQVLKVKNG